MQTYIGLLNRLRCFFCCWNNKVYDSIHIFAKIIGIYLKDNIPVFVKKIFQSVDILNPTHVQTHHFSACGLTLLAHARPYYHPNISFLFFYLFPTYLPLRLPPRHATSLFHQTNITLASLPSPPTAIFFP